MLTLTPAEKQSIAHMVAAAIFAKGAKCPKCLGDKIGAEINFKTWVVAVSCPCGYRTADKMGDIEGIEKQIVSQREVSQQQNAIHKVIGGVLEEEAQKIINEPPKK